LSVLWVAYFHSSSGAHTTVSTTSGICHTVTAICRYRGRVGTGLLVLYLFFTRFRPTMHINFTRFKEIILFRFLITEY
jgi:hypothetical protein